MGIAHPKVLTQVLQPEEHISSWLRYATDFSRLLGTFSATTTIGSESVRGVFPSGFSLRNESAVVASVDGHSYSYTAISGEPFDSDANVGDSRISNSSNVYHIFVQDAIGKATE